MAEKDAFVKELYFVTTTVVDWIDIFSRAKYKHLYWNRWRIVRRRKDWKFMLGF